MDTRCSPVASHDQQEAVVLLHGLARSAASMRVLGDRLCASKFTVHNLDYPSTQAPLQSLLKLIRGQIDARCHAAPRLHFVTFSLGGILVRALLADQTFSNLGRVVMLAPPNKGSELIDHLRGLRAFRYFFGPVAQELGTGPESLPNRLGRPNFELGVIAGTRAVNPLGWLLIPGESDGTVAVERTTLPEMSDFIVVPHSHTFIMNSKRIARETVAFLRRGRFSEDAERRANIGVGWAEARPVE